MSLFRKRQVEQHGDLMQNIYNMGSGMRTVKFDEAAEAMFKRTYPEIKSNTQMSPIFIPETFIPRVPIGVDLENYNDQFEKPVRNLQIKHIRRSQVGTYKDL